MQLIKRSSYLLAILLIIGFGLAFFYYDKITVVTFINSVFLVSMLYIMVGGLMFVTRGGFFDAFTHSFRRLMKKGTRMGEIMDDVENMHLPSEAFEYTYSDPLLITGLIGFLTTVLISFNI
ncbi:DUF3899 domain-containing protein [Pseudalkalibacillus salsuginis]|uniref:DUF3899 domain-containing protein n=1 Tax=Pseudalkalibacillus salsuginis TaxID=2910972 RepID=UPI001F3F3AC0|nr:DUF3899 domain-containing protein [Pseudalkalibacillus salsuginis]MCF6409207.1 DUF3899 domain-containing protein [Pseudalkalibacillus salsuginis]